MMSGNITRFECPVCLESYDKNIIPKLLPCVHTVCLDCLTDLLKRGKGKKLVCPVCRSDINVPKKGASGFKTNIYLVPDRDESVKKAEKPTCSFCAEEDKNFQALRCGHRLCITCTNFSESPTPIRGTTRCPICTDHPPNLPGSNLYPVLSTDTLLGENNAGSEIKTDGGQTNATNSKHVQTASHIVPLTDKKLPNTQTNDANSKHIPTASHTNLVSGNKQPCTQTNAAYTQQAKPVSHMVPALGMKQPTTQQPPKKPLRLIGRPARPAPPPPAQHIPVVKGPNLNQSTKPSPNQGLSEQRIPGPTPGRPLQRQLLQQDAQQPVAVAVAEQPPGTPVVPTAPQLDLFDDEEESPYDTVYDIGSPYETIFNVKDPLEDEDWYVGELTRQESVRKLMSLPMADGLFFVRKNAKGVDGNHAYTIDVMYNRLAYHIQILRQPDGKYILGKTTYKPKEFDNVRSLIHFHKQTPLTMASKETKKEIGVTLK